MLFNSISFLLFLPVVFIIFWFLLKKSHTGQNILILVASYVFYGWWDYRFLFLILASTVVDYAVGLLMTHKNSKASRRTLLYISIFFNLGLLAVFKYFNFFIDNFNIAFQAIGFQSNISSLEIILPVGISFYTFQTLSYTIDVYKKRIKPEYNFIRFAGFVAFFPQLVAGPIERAKHLLPQFAKKREFNAEWAISGFHLIIWGLFQKVVIADNCAVYVNAIFEDYSRLNSGTLITGAIYFAFQIYGDFAGYSNMAIGTARLFGFDLMQNFNYPYFSRNVAEFWRRWHISLSTWFRDYLYIPLGGSKVAKAKVIRNVFIIFLVSGFWHGANWTFLVWGGLHALFFIPLLLTNKNRKYLKATSKKSVASHFHEIIQIIYTFSLVTFAWIIFRAENFETAMGYIKRMFLNLNFQVEYLSIERYSIELFLILAILIGLEWLHRFQEHPFVGKFKILKLMFVIFLLLTLGQFFENKEFIYFQF